MRSIVYDLKGLRKQFLSKEISRLDIILDRLVKSGILNCLISCQEDDIDDIANKDSGWIYILSTRVERANLFMNNLIG